MRSVKSKNTKPELLIRKVLTLLGYRYRLHVKDLPGKPDIVFKKRQKVIFIHGCFWHGHEGCARGVMADSDFWRKKIKSNKERDQDILFNLTQNNWTYLIIWECELRNLNSIESKLLEFLGAPPVSNR